MDAKTVRDSVIKPKLAEVFGNVMANLLLTKAVSASMKGGSEQEKLKLMVDAICSNPKVTGMWGAAQTQKQQAEWLRAL